MAYVRIVHHWDDQTATSIEVGTDDAAHPDLLDELASRAISLWRETCGSAGEAEA